jgi:transcriptional regulator with XRE-family HTH domain
MPVRHRASQRGARRGHDELDRLLREAEEARVAAGLSYAALARALGLSKSHVARILRRGVTDVGVIRVAQVLAVVGLELTARAHPVAPPVRDAASVALLDRLRTRLSPACVCRTEVPVLELPATGFVDLRAWDLAIDGPGWTARLDAETRLGDVQALQRRIALKQRDGRVSCVILLVSRTRHNREVIRAAEASLRAQFPISPRLALQRLGRGESPRGNSMILL